MEIFLKFKGIKVWKDSSNRKSECWSALILRLEELISQISVWLLIMIYALPKIISIEWEELQGLVKKVNQYLL